MTFEYADAIEDMLNLLLPKGWLATKYSGTSECFVLVKHGPFSIRVTDARSAVAALEEARGQ